MKYFDAHCHVNFAAYEGDRDETIQRAKKAQVGINIVGTQRDTSAAAVELAGKYDNVYATVGLHPIHTSKSYHDEKELGKEGKAFTSRGEMFDRAVYEELGRSERVIAIGECGLDYYRCDERTKGLQKKVFVEHIELANKLGKPLMLHIRASDGRDAYEDTLEILKAHARVKGDTHFFAGNLETAKEFLDLGFTLSFTGVLTFTHDYDEVVRSVPLDMLLSETDAPYVTPTPHRGKRNEPSYVVEVARAIARIRRQDFDEVAIQLMENARRVFSL